MNHRTDSGGELPYRQRHLSQPSVAVAFPSKRGSAILQKLTEEIADCYLQAEQCRLRAKCAIDPALKQDFLDMERRWLTMARSYEFTEQLSDFINRPPTPDNAKNLSLKARTAGTV